METALLIAYVSILSVLVPLSFAVIQWNHVHADISALRWLLIAALIADAVMLILSQVFSLPNTAVGDVYMFIQFTFLLYIFSLQFDRKLIFKIVYAAVVSFYALSLLFQANYAASTTNFNAISSLVFIVVSIVFFYKLLNELKVVNIHRLPILWVSFATLFYYSGNLFVFLAVALLDKENYLLSWKLHNILNITKNILFAVALWQSYRMVKSST